MTWLSEHWSLVIFVALGFAAVWILLPQARLRPVGAGLASGLIALIVGGNAFLQATGGEWFPADLLFYLFAGFAVLAAACMITHRNPVYSALWFAIVILSTCGLFLLESAPFLAAATVIVYAGAIIVTFLFVIMLAQQTGAANYDRTTREPFLATLAGFVLLGALLDVLQRTYSAPTAVSQVAEQLAKVNRLIDAKANDQQIDDAMHLTGAAMIAGADRSRSSAERPAVTEVLDAEVKRTPDEIWPFAKKKAVAVQIDAATTKWSEAKNAPGGRDAARMKEAIKSLELIAEELAHDYPRHPSTLPIPDQTRRYLAKPRPATAGPNVAGLGRSLFTEYLFAVELAGTLLLIATIGAIAIAGRRKEIAP